MNGNLRSVLCVVCFAFAWGLFPVRQALRAQEPAVPADRLEGDVEAEPVVAVPESGAPVVESDAPETESVPEEMAGASEAWMEEMDEQERETLWTVRASALYRGNMDVGIRGVSSAGAAPPIAGGNRAPAGIGGLGGYANRNYDNGFVYIDPGTAFPGTLIPGLTWYWGYRDGGQYNAAGETLRFTKAGGERFSQSVVRNQKLEFDEETEAPGFSLELSRDWKVMGLDSSVTLGFNGFWMDSVEVAGEPYEELVRRSTYRVMDTYDTSKGGPPPPAPYSGTYAGPGYVISNIPQARDEVTTSSQTWRALGRVELEVDSELYQVWLGPRLDCALRDLDVIRFGIQPYVSLSYLDVEATRTETVQWSGGAGGANSTMRRSAQASEDDLLPGLGIRASVDWAFLPTWAIGLMGGYDWVADEVEVQVGGVETEVDVSGYVIGLTLVKEF